MSKDVRLVREAASLEHRLAHFPKNPACHICAQSRMYRKKVEKLRHDPLSDRGALPEVEEFGERVAADVIIVVKSKPKAKDGSEVGVSSSFAAESTVLVVRDEFSGYLRAFPLTQRTTENVVKGLLQFIGKHVKKPMIMFKSDNAKELEAACQQLGWVSEPTLANRWPHNSVLERDIRTLEEVARAVHLQSGFQIRPGLWPHSCVYAAFVLNLRHKLRDAEHTRYVAAVGSEFDGRQLLLGQLVFYRTDPAHRGKFDPSAPGLFAGWRLDRGRVLSPRLQACQRRCCCSPCDFCPT